MPKKKKRKVRAKKAKVKKTRAKKAKGKQHVVDPMVKRIRKRYITARHELAKSIWTESKDHSKALGELEKAAIDLLAVERPPYSLPLVPNEEELKELVFWAKVAQRTREIALKSKEEFTKGKIIAEMLANLKQPLRQRKIRSVSLWRDLLQRALAECPSPHPPHPPIYPPAQAHRLWFLVSK